MAEWLNTAFSDFDFAILRFGHNMHLSAGGFFDGFMRFITVFGDGGIFFILLAIALMAFKKTRKIGITIFGAIAIGAIITNLIVKPTVARPRPYMDESSIYYTWWQAVGALQESEFSFPSGHSTASMAAMMAFFLAGNKKYSWTGFIFALLIGFSRIYLCVHYPSDVLFGFLIGIAAGTLSYIIVHFAYKYLQRTKFADILLEKDVITLYHYLQGKRMEKKAALSENQDSVGDVDDSANYMDGDDNKSERIDSNEDNA